MNNVSGKYLALGISVVLAGATIFAYKDVQAHKFLNYDDAIYVTENPYVKEGLTLRSVVWAFESPHAGFWHPLTWLSHILDVELFGLNPKYHHLVNLLLHTANSLLLFWILKGMTGAVWRSGFVAAAFALHPLHVESVAWVSERKDLLSTLFFMLTMAAYLRYVKCPGMGRSLLVLVLFAAGLTAKPMLVTLPFVLLLLDYWPLERLRSKRDVKDLVIEKVPLFVLSAVFCVIALFSQQLMGALAMKLPFEVRLANVFVSYIRYIEKMIWPANLTVFYPHSRSGLEVWQAVGSFAIVLGISVLAVWAGRTHKYLAVGWFWYLGTLVPVIGLVQVGSFGMADRYSYVPLIGLFIIGAWGVPDFLPVRRYRDAALGMLCAAVLLSLLICTSRQVRYWRDDFSLFEHTIAVTGKNSMAHYNLGVAYGKSGWPKEAIGAFKRAVEINPNDADAWYNLGIAYGEAGNWTEAAESHKGAIRVKPNYAEAYYGLGVAYGNMGNPAEEIKAYAEAVKNKPDYIEAYCNLGVTYGQAGRFEEAIEAYKRAVKIKPDAAQIYYNLGVTYNRLGRYPEAAEAYKQAVRIRPDYAEAHFGLGMAYVGMGDKASATEQCRILKQMKAESAEMLSNLISQ
jgi:tetratricopeptide (TPR) repeat protein